MSLNVSQTAPVLSTPDTHIFEDPTPPVDTRAFPKLSDEQLYITYEIERTVREIKTSRWRRVALQFPDEMLTDAPRISERLSEGLARQSETSMPHSVEEVTSSLEKTELDVGNAVQEDDEPRTKITILADTSYGSCCVDEIAAEHVDAEVVVHYGRTCLSPTARLPVIYVYTTKPLDQDSVVATFQKTYADKTAKVVLVADIPYHGHVDGIATRLRDVGYSNLFAPAVIHDPSSLLPNRTLPEGVASDPALLQDYSLFHISDPPTSLLLNVSSRVSSIYIYPTTAVGGMAVEAISASTAQMLRRRYALVTRLSTVPIFGILINTLSVKNYLAVLGHVKDFISKAGKKYYTFVVGKVNAAKVANFQEVEAWVVIGCWESSLIESQEFWRPIITPFELELALTDEKDRLWTGQWNSDIQAILNKGTAAGEIEAVAEQQDGGAAEEGDAGDDSEEESEPPVFDFRTGRYVSQSRPMARTSKLTKKINGTSTSLMKRANGDLAQMGGEVSPAAEYLRSKRTWQGLGSDYEIAYQYDGDGKLQGAPMEQGRGGIAKGYAVGEEEKT